MENIKNKYEHYVELLEKEVLKSTQTKENWLFYLDGASRNYKYPFVSQLLINSQKPNATAIADYDFWTKKAKRTVKKSNINYKTAIQIPFMDENGRKSLKNYFDIVDTIENKNSPPLPKWSVSEEKHETIINELSEVYNIELEKSLDTAIYKSVNFAVSEYLKNNIEEINRVFKNYSIFTSREDRDLVFSEIVKASINVVISKRLNNNYQDYIDTINDHIQKFASESVIQAIGNAVSTVSEEILKNIEVAVKKYDKEKNQNKEQKNYDRRIHPATDQRHNILQTEERTGIQRDGISNEIGRPNLQQGNNQQNGRMDDHGVDRQRRQEKSLPVSEHFVGRTTDRTGILGTETSPLPPRTQQISNGHDRNETSKSLQRDREPSSGNVQSNDKRSSTETREQTERERQSSRPNSMGRTYEQHEASNTRNHIQRTDLQLDTSQTQASSENYDVFSLNQQKIPPVFVVDWKSSKQNFDLNLYESSDIVAYDRNGVSYQVTKIGETIIESATTSVTSLGEILGDINIPISIRNQIKAYRNGEITDEEVSKETLKKDEQLTLFKKIKEKEVEVERDFKPQNFRMDSIDYSEVTEGGAKAKFKRNIEAIKTLQLVESENRLATSEEQKILAKYVGWGGIQEAFYPHNQKWSEEYKELKELLTPNEWETARASVLTAYYTEPTIMTAMWDKIEEMGGYKNSDNLNAVHILEPSLGIGNFLGTMPQNISSNIHGVEIDSISGRIARKLYPNAKIQVTGFEKTLFEDEQFDVVIGNVPFSDTIKPVDWKYDKNKLPIHDYFFNKALDKVKPGGVVAFITSSYTLDKINNTSRKMIAEKADLLGAIRLPNNAFKDNAGTEVVSDIIFLQKREITLNNKKDQMPYWLETTQHDYFNAANYKSFHMNNYFHENPHMILGEYKEVSGPYGKRVDLLPFENSNFDSQLKKAMSHIQGKIPLREIVKEYFDVEITTKSISFNVEDNCFFDTKGMQIVPTPKDSSYTIVNGELYFRNGNYLNPIDPENKKPRSLERQMGMLGVRDTLRSLIKSQVDDRPNIEIEQLQKELNKKYDNFAKNYGLITSTENAKVFDDDDSYYLLCSLEMINDEGEYTGKSDIFSKRTIKPHIEVTSVDTPSEALAISLGYLGKIDLEYMAKLTGFDQQKIINDLTLQGVIFLEKDDIYVTSDEYLSGNVREKLVQAKELAKTDPRFEINVEYLEKVQPIELEAHEISVRLGTTWIEPHYVQQFMYETLETSNILRGTFNLGDKPDRWSSERKDEKDRIVIRYSSISNEWRITNKNSVSTDDIKASVEFGTKRLNAYHILEQTLNLKDVVIKDKIEEKEVINEEQTTLARQKQEDLKNLFKDWIFKDPERRSDLVSRYNVKFNSIQPRKYDGSHIIFSGMNTEIKLEEHQVNAVARVMYGGNTLLAHEVGAGKTFEMIAAAMESKRLGLVNKSLIAVPKHLTGQTASEFLRLYPNANILVATDKTFDIKNRKRFLGKIATGNYDAIIIGHTQFEKIPLSDKTQERFLKEQFDHLVDAIEEARSADSSRFTIKQMENAKNRIATKLDNLYKGIKKDNVIEFEQLGVDKIFVDESHNYKNLHLYTKMRNVAGIAQTEAQKSADMFMKCRYLSELTNNKGVVFATGTPISNSLTEMYTIQKYLQYDKLVEMDLEHFDQWASVFTETTAEMELAPEGKGYRMRTRCSTFHNLPELMNNFNIYDDIKTKLIAKGIPDKEIAFIHDYNSDKQKQQLFSKVRNGSIRVLFGSTEKMGAGTNIQNRLVALHHLDCPWRPSDLTQREGRILRRGNQNSQVEIYKYVTKDTFDAYMYQTIEKKQQFITQIMTEKTPLRAIEDIDQSVLNYAEIKALCVGNPKIKEKMDLEQDLKKLNLLKKEYNRNLYSMQDSILKKFPLQIKAKEQNIENYKADEIRLKSKTIKTEENNISSLVVNGKTYNKRIEAGEAIKLVMKNIENTEGTTVGTYRGFDIHLSFDKFVQQHKLTLIGDMKYPINLDGDFSAQGLVTRMDNLLEKIPAYIKDEQNSLQNVMQQLEIAKIEVTKPFAYAEELKEKTERVTELNLELSLDNQKTKNDDQAMDNETQYESQYINHHENNFAKSIIYKKISQKKMIELQSYEKINYEPLGRTL